MGARALVAYEVMNLDTRPVSVNMTLDPDVNLAGYEDAPVGSLDDGTGFEIEACLIPLRVHTRAFPLVADTGKTTPRFCGGANGEIAIKSLKTAIVSPDHTSCLLALHNHLNFNTSKRIPL
jgi:hypothetical protein